MSRRGKIKLFSVSRMFHPETKEILSLYVRFREEKVAETVEKIPDRLLLDLDRRGHLLGFEMIGPCKVRVQGVLRIIRPNLPEKIAARLAGNRRFERALEPVCVG